ncbi:MAG: hypothetical protein C5B43_02685, partial [Verrucomicrobia bacterium]
MKLKFLSLLFLILTSFTCITYAEDEDQNPLPQNLEDYRVAIKDAISDLNFMNPGLLMNFCKILNIEEDGFNKTLFYYQKQYELLASGFPYVLEINKDFIYLLETINHNIEKEQTNFNNFTSLTAKCKCLKNLYHGLLGSYLIIDRILDGEFSNLTQIHKASKKLASKKANRTFSKNSKRN